MAEKKFLKEYVVIGPSGNGAVGKPNSSTSGRDGPSKEPPCESSSFSGDDDEVAL